MNIFILDSDPETAAQQQCDKHVVKMVLETAQMLCAAWPSGEAPYKRTHAKHPCTLWALESLQNFEWLINHGLALAAEYRKRYGRSHKSERVIDWVCERYYDLDLPQIGLTPFAQAMPDEYKQDDPVAAYRAYYQGEKSDIAVWKHSEAPEWWT